MKHNPILLFCAGLALMAGLATSCHSSKKKAGPKPSEATETAAPPAAECRLLTDSLLPQSVDLDQDISRLSYEELRIQPPELRGAAHPPELSLRPARLLVHRRRPEPFLLPENGLVL